MKKKDIGILLTCIVLGTGLCGTAVTAKAAEDLAGAAVQTAALKVSSYKGESLTAGEIRQEHGLPELPVDDRLMNSTQDVSTQHFREHTQYEREAVIAYGWLYGGCHNLICFNMASDGSIAQRAVTNWANSPGHLRSMLREDVTCIGEEWFAGHTNIKTGRSSS